MVRFLTTIIVCLLTVVIKAQGQEPTFISQGVEDGIRQHLNISEDDQICFQQLDTITTLDLSKRGITDIRDLGLMPKLRVLDLSGNQVEYLQPLAVLDSLEWLDLSSNNLRGINDLFYSSSKKMTINVSFNYINDFSLFALLSSCSFTLIGTGLQYRENAPYFEINSLYADINNDEMPVVSYSGFTNLTTDAYLKYGSSAVPAQLDGETHQVAITEDIAEATIVTISNGEVSKETYVVPSSNFKVGAGQNLTLVTGLPDDYEISYAIATFGTVEIVGSNLQYTAAENAVPDVIYFGYFKDYALKGYSRFYLNRIKKGDVNDDGAVDKTDLDMVVSYVMNPSDDFNKYAADINNDDKVDVADIVLIVKMIKNY